MPKKINLPPPSRQNAPTHPRQPFKQRNGRPVSASYYAIRVGYAPYTSFNDDEDMTIDDHQIYIPPRTPPIKKRKRDDNSSVDTNGEIPMLKINSAIFLYWEDARHFVDSTEDNDERRSIYSSFSTLAEAEAYLLSGEEENASRMVRVAQKSLGHKTAGVNEAKKVIREKMPPKRRGFYPDGYLDEKLYQVARSLPTYPAVAAGGNSGKGLPLGQKPPPVGQNDALKDNNNALPSDEMKPRKKKISYWEENYRKLVKYHEEHGTIDVQIPESTANKEKKQCSKDGDVEAEVEMKEDDNNDVDARAEENKKESDNKGSEDGDAKTEEEMKKGDKDDIDTEVEEQKKESDDGVSNEKEAKEGPNDNADAKTKQLKKLRSWSDYQIVLARRRSRGYADAISAEQLQKLRDLGMVLPPSYDEMYQKLAAHRAANGTLEVNKDEDEELYRWTKEQKKILIRHFQGIEPVPLTQQQISDLEKLGFERHVSEKSNILRVKDTGSEEKKWEEMLEGLIRYKAKHGHHSFPTDTSLLTREERFVMYWVRAQRVEYKKLKSGKESSLTARQLQKLNSAGLDMSPKKECRSWEEHMQNLREFVAEHGHCKPHKSHPTLWSFVNNTRHFYRLREKGMKTSLTDERINDLKELGFVFNAGKSPNCTKVRKNWEERFAELLEFKKENGHTIVRQKSGPLGTWVKSQRDEYKKFKNGDKKTTMTAERALRLTEIGFCFDASSLFPGNRQKVVENGGYDE